MPIKLPFLPRRLKNLPVLLLILANVIVGLRTFRDYGLSLDEPLFYGYGDAIGYAYTPTNWFRPDFDLENAYGPSPWDHRNRGPAYLLLARGPAHLLQLTGLDQASAWHLVNFLAFQIGVFFFYVLARRWLTAPAAFFATAFFSTQPVLWEQAFINPKDPPFLVFFLITLEFGFRMADYLATAPASEKPAQIIRHLTLPGVMLGLTTSIRILGPLAAFLIGLYFLLLRKPSRLWAFLPYGLLAILVMFISWPYLWEAPISNFFGTFTFMADNPTRLRVLFYGQIYRADNLPLRYLPAMLLFTLTEPVWPLAILGMLAAFVRMRTKSIEWKSLFATFLWLAIPLAYVLVARPPMYDGFRHFLFIVPPLFLLGGLAVEALFGLLRNVFLRVVLILLLLAPALIADVQLHPYQYTYYNQLVGGTGQAASRFETDYWFTCYKEAVRRFNRLARSKKMTLFVHREGDVAAYYASKRVKVVDMSKALREPDYGDFILSGSRANPDIQLYRDDTRFITIKRDNAVFCLINVKTK